ncbi:PepSY domain-containing protein [Actinoplanes sp. NPDC051411]|uniref:PepSY domain-containing protein n=1 Tax=Actinoplanes sp. NPDC051411 TaxID=3155522 RepID=UPI003424158F
MKRTSILVASIGAAAVLGVGGTALAATTGDDNGLRGDGTVDDNGGAAAPAVSPSAGGTVSATDAEGLALAATGGGRVIRVEAETEHGVAVWSVRIVVNGVRYDLDVDRGTGEVLPHGHGADDGVAGDRHGGDDNVTGDRHGVKTASDDKGGATAATRVEAADDKGGRRATTARHAEPGDDKGGERATTARHAEPGDDKGGHGNEAGDDHGHHGNDD